MASALLACGCAVMAPRPAGTASSPALVAPGDCWIGPAGDAAALPRMLRHCAQLGAQAVRLRVPDALQAGDEPTICAGEACLALGRALTLNAEGASMPLLLLDTPVERLDEIQQAVIRAGAAHRVWIEPRFARPQGTVARIVVSGLRYRREMRSDPRPLALHVLEIDQRAGEFEFVTTAPARAATGGEAEAYAAERTSDFARREHLLAAVNAGYFLPFDGGRLLHQPYVPQAGAMATVSPMRIDGLGVSSQSDPRVNGVVCLGPNDLLPSSAGCPPGLHAAFAAGPMLLEHGQRSSLQARNAAQEPDATGVARYYREPQPRTAIGANPGLRKLWLVVADGRQQRYSEGLSLPELTDILADLGATEAINLDGGGSSTLALNSQGETRVANSPIHTSIPGRERPVANHLGLRLAPH